MRISDWSSDVCSSDLLDRNALPPPTLQASAATPPEGATEQAIAQVWQSVLERGTISRHDDFFALGGKSLDAMHVVSSEEHTSELQSLMRISYAVFCLKKKHNHRQHKTH